VHIWLRGSACNLAAEGAATVRALLAGIATAAPGQGDEGP
jgi:hypothetical protein